jgi:CMP-N,N'-diacetyllegionaminic acid synthase
MIAIIPARGGSKGLPGKNIKEFCGKPLIVHSIEAAQQAKSISRIIVSTDDEKIALIAKEHGADIPFLRPARLSTDNALAIDNYLYTINRLREEQHLDIPEFVVLQPTSPLRTFEDIDRAVELFFEKNADSVISVTEMAHPPVWAKRINSKGTIEEYFSINEGLKNRQKIEKAYIPNGAIFVLKESLLKDHNTYYSDKTFPYIMNAERSVDIDNSFDFDYAEFLMNKKINSGNGRY